MYSDGLIRPATRNDPQTRLHPWTPTKKPRTRRYAFGEKTSQRPTTNANLRGFDQENSNAFERWNPQRAMLNGFWLQNRLCNSGSAIFFTVPDAQAGLCTSHPKPKGWNGKGLAQHGFRPSLQACMCHTIHQALLKLVDWVFEITRLCVTAWFSWLMRSVFDPTPVTMPFLGEETDWLSRWLP